MAVSCVLLALVRVEAAGGETYAGIGVASADVEHFSSRNDARRAGNGELGEVAERCEFEKVAHGGKVWYCEVGHDGVRATLMGSHTM